MRLLWFVCLLTGLIRKDLFASWGKRLSFDVDLYPGMFSIGLGGAMQPHASLV